MEPNVKVLQELSHFQKQKIKIYFTPAQPFGPRSSEDIKDDELVQPLIFNTRNSIWKSYQKDPSIIVGRRGSGKTTVVSRTELAGKFKYIIFADLAKLSEKVSHALFSESQIKLGRTERCADYWSFVLNVQHMIEVVRSNPAEPFPRISSFLEAIDRKPKMGEESYLKRAFRASNRVELNNSLGPLLASITNFLADSAHGYQEALSDLDYYLKESNTRSVIILDNVEQYDLDDCETKEIMKGMLKCVGTFGNRYRQIRLCIPAEHFFEIKAISSNATKDFGNAVVLHWSPIELMRIAAWRYLVFLAAHNHIQRLNKFEAIDLSKREDVHSVLSDFMKDTTVNRGKKIEGTLAYVLRHTQLLPRQFIMTLNSIYKSAEDGGFNYAADVVDGIRNVEPDICGDIFNAFQTKFPFCEDLCDRVVEKLPRYFSQDRLESVYAKFGKGALKSRQDIDFHRFRKVLSEIGAIGKVTGQTTMYKDADFEYGIPGQLSFAPSDEFCLHPAFSGAFESAENIDSVQYVYPHLKFLKFDGYLDRKLPI
ncbi:hypothetical protein ROLI_005810 [Roseobacter fucihabitans]|uniref:Uncharacterized protein n=1 Tax=Roseobacter fucihabitans TaxID=1537242 RepID=A0ABZ2BNB7_9RHOB|nr:hypothetical protein [Roseobacter litoralis]MBC6967720.1 hypothetical protein [Roseobacter litoralis]